MITLNKQQFGEEDINTANQILDYLLKHPYAKDTLQGILQWGVLTGKIKNSVKEIKNGIKILKSTGLITEEKLKGCDTYFQVKRERFDVLEISH